jgi:hypothetical protein
VENKKIFCRNGLEMCCTLVYCSTYRNTPAQLEGATQ